MEKSLIEKKPQFIEDAAGFSGKDMRKNKKLESFRLYSSGSLDHMNMSFSVTLNDGIASVKHKRVLRAVDVDDPRQRPLENFEVHSEDVKSFIDAYINIDVCAQSLPKNIGTDGTNWLFEATVNGEYCSDIFWGGRKPEKFLPIIAEMEKILALREK